MSEHRGLDTENQRTKWMLKICYSFYREWSTAKEFEDMDEPNSFRHHLASNRAYQCRLHIDKQFPKWMIDACAKMLSEKKYEYDFQRKTRITEHQMRLKWQRMQYPLDDIPF